MSAAARPPYRADHVGSLLKPRELSGPEAATGAARRKIEDDAIREAVAMQESAGLQSITDGEIRRAFWHVDFLTSIEGITATHSDYALSFRGDHGETATTSSMLVVSGKLRRPRPIMLDSFVFLKNATGRTAKCCIPAPSYLHMRGGRKVVSRTAYPDLDEFWADIVRVYREEIQDLAAAGCSYLQLDDVTFAMLGDAEVRAQTRRDGEDPERLPSLYVNIINAVIAERPASLAVTIHTCRGNHNSMWMASGGYEAVAETAFSQLRTDGFFLEYDSDRAGGFEPLRFMPKGKKVVLGLVSSKTPVLESKDDLKHRIEAAAKYVAMEDLCLSPQCGFSSTPAGNRLTKDDQRRKLALVVDVAQEVWGSAL